MKRILLIVIVVLLTSCSKPNEVKACRYAQMISSFASVDKNNLAQCKSYYLEFENAKINRKLNTESVLRINSMMIRFEFEENESVNYWLNKDGLFTYEDNGFTYQAFVRKELFTELIENIEILKQSQSY